MLGRGTSTRQDCAREANKEANVWEEKAWEVVTRLATKRPLITLMNSDLVGCQEAKVRLGWVGEQGQKKIEKI